MSVMYIHPSLYVQTSLQMENEPWHTSKCNVTSWDLCFFAQQKGADQGWEGRGLPLVRSGTASGGRLTGKLSLGCLADTKWTSLTNEGLHPICWGELSTSWPDGSKISFKLLVILIRDLRGTKGLRSLSSMQQYYDLCMDVSHSVW